MSTSLLRGVLDVGPILREVAGASGQRPEEPGVAGIELLVPVGVAYILHRLLDRWLLQPVGVREQPKALHELPDMFGVGLVRDLIVLPTEPPVEDRHLPLVSPRSTKDPLDFELVLRLHAIPHVMKVFLPPEKSEVVAVHHAPNVASLVVEHSRGCHPLREAP